VERLRFGASDEAAHAQVERELHGRFDRSADLLAQLERPLHALAGLLAAAERDPAAARTLFDRLDAALEDSARATTGVTIYAGDAPVAWTGRVTDIPRDRILGPEALFVALGALGPRLVRVDPLTDPARPTVRA